MLDSIILVVGVAVGILIILPFLKRAEMRRNTVDPKRVVEELQRLSEKEIRQDSQASSYESPQPILKRSEVLAKRRNRQSFGTSEDEHALLHRWLEEGKIEISDNDFLGWLSKQAPDTWHAIVINWNWDYGSAPLLWIVSQPECDLGTAFHIFFIEASNWMTNLTWEELDYPSYQESWKTCKTIVDRWEQNDFGSAELMLRGYEQAQSYRKMEQNALEAGKQLAWVVPEYVYEYQGVRQHRSDFTWADGTLMHSFEYWKQQQQL
ncbi:DUF4274 domain-containing protein [Yoonia sp. BS5-3]|uniref:DUF4274 domain-containing protein n=1 Tax=Yoonia phaeophyticola TaxID=3137369 RepID=A0ABZ2V822_9RHOB